MATTQEAEEDDDHGEDDMVMTSTASDSTAGSVAPSRASDRDDERLAPYTSGDSDGEGVMSSSVSDREEEGIMSSSVSDSEEEGMTSSRVSGREDEGIASSRVGDNEEDGMTSSRASESEHEGTASLRAGDGECGRLVPYTESERSEDDRLVPYTDESESEDELIGSSRPAANGGGPAAPKDDAHAVRRASHRPVESRVAKTKDKDYSVEKQRASKSVPLVSRFGLDLYDLGDANESAADTLSPPSSRLDGRGGGHAKSARTPPDSLGTEDSPSAERKPPRPADGRGNRAGDAKHSGEPGSRNVDISPNHPAKTPDVPAAESKTKRTRAKKRHADRVICDAGKRAGLETVGAISLRNMTLATAEHTPGNISLTRRASLGRVVALSSNPKTSSKRRASIAATRAEATPRGETSLRDGKPGTSESRARSPESPASPETTVPAENGGLSSAATPPNTPKGRVPVHQGIAGRRPPTSATKTPKSPKTPVARLGRSTNGVGSGTGSRNRGTPQGRKRGGIPEGEKVDSGDDASSDITSETSGSSEEEFRMTSNAESGDPVGGGGGGGAGVAGAVPAAWAGTRPTHKKKVWRAGRRVPPTFFGLARQKDAKIEVLWDVTIKSTRITKVRSLGTAGISVCSFQMGALCRRDP